MYCTYAASPLKLRPPVKSLPCARSPGWNELHWTRITKRGSTSVQHKERGQRPPARARLARGFTSGRGGRVGDVDGGRSPPHPIHPSSAINRCTCYRCHRQGGQPVCCTPVNPLAPPPLACSPHFPCPRYFVTLFGPCCRSCFIFVAWLWPCRISSCKCPLGAVWGVN